MVTEVHAAGRKIIPLDLAHGRAGNVNDYSETEIRDIVNAFANTETEPKHIGFDGIEN
ncbi:hypothetical protein [Paenibacillus sp. Soil724D2]|uniref:hypothetical protein n=1 Tax=Paenibacillus sp. (strain Soil724D2) TaxID=1736392 RepID=UPI000B01B50E|nr:hypothetical protein [Paenibacillus sp. Soil724D2]